jgi:two-component sensor histidine kinase
MKSLINKVSLYFLLQFAGWLLLIGYYFVPELFTNSKTSNLWLISIPIYFVAIIFTHCYRLLLKKRNVQYSNLRQVITYGSAGIFLLAIIATTMSILLIYFFKLDDMFEVDGTKAEPMNLIDYIYSYLELMRMTSPWFFCYHLYKFAESYNKKAADAAKAEALTKNNQLITLKNQLNPHFFFNALNSIKSLTITNPAVARDAIDNLSELLRNSLDSSDKNLIPLHKELEFVDEYLYIEKLRYAEKLDLKYEVQEEAKNMLVLPMCLQVLVENAVKHGIANTKNGGIITITANAEEDDLLITVINYSRSPLVNGTGIGLSNLKQRLALMFGEAASFTLRSEDINADKTNYRIHATLQQKGNGRKN